MRDGGAGSTGGGAAVARYRGRASRQVERFHYDGVGHLESAENHGPWAVERFDDDLAVLAPGVAPQSLREDWQVNLVDELTQRDRRFGDQIENEPRIYNNLHQVTDIGAVHYDWDVNGNLSRRDADIDTIYTHDWRDRLVGVQQGAVRTDLVVDPLGRLVAKVVHAGGGDVARVYLHDGDQVVAEYVQDAGSTAWQLDRRHHWGRWIDDLVAEEIDTDANGILDTTLYPVTDLLGTVQLLTDEDGRIVERIEYDPDGTPHFFSADQTAPAATRLAWTGDGALPAGGSTTAQVFEIGFSEWLDGDGVAAAVATLTPDSGSPVTLTASLGADLRSVVLTGAAPTDGVTYTVHLEGVQDRAGNAMYPFEATFTVVDATAYEVLEDSVAPTLLALMDTPEAMVLVFDEPIAAEDGNLAGALTVHLNGQPVAGTAEALSSSVLRWTPDDGNGLEVGTWGITATNLVDLAGNTLTAPPPPYRHVEADADMVVYTASTDSQPASASAYGVKNLFQGREWHRELGLYYHRVRWYRPDAHTPLETDPVEYLDSSSLYQWIVFSPANHVDPDGLHIRETVGVLNHKKIQKTKALFLGTALGLKAWNTLDDLMHWTRPLGIDAEKLIIDWSQLLPPRSLVYDRGCLDHRLRKVPSVITVMLRKEDTLKQRELGHVVEDYEWGYYGGLASARVKFGTAFGAAGDKLPKPYYWFGRLLGGASSKVRRLHDFAHEFGHAYGAAISEQYREFSRDMEQFNTLRLQIPPGQPFPKDTRDRALKAKKAVEDFAEDFALLVVTESDGS